MKARNLAATLTGSFGTLNLEALFLQLGEQVELGTVERLFDFSQCSALLTGVHGRGP